MSPKGAGLVDHLLWTTFSKIKQLTSAEREHDLGWLLEPQRSIWNSGAHFLV